MVLFVVKRVENKVILFVPSKASNICLHSVDDTVCVCICVCISAEREVELVFDFLEACFEFLFGFFDGTRLFDVVEDSPNGVIKPVEEDDGAALLLISNQNRNKRTKRNQR